MSMYSSTRHVQTEIPKALHRKFKSFCVEKEVTQTTMLSQIITEWINNNIICKEKENGQEKNG